MCRLIHKDLKKQSAPGLPVGWTFVSGVGSVVTLISPCGDELNSVQDALDRCHGQIDDAEASRLKFVTHVGGSPCGDELNSVQDAWDRCHGQITDAEASRFKFVTHVGGSLIWKDDSHFLVGKEYCHEWTDVCGRNKVIYGVITSCERNSLDENDVTFTVTYNEESIKGVERMRPFREWSIESTTTMSLEWALGGYLAYASKHEPLVLEESLVSAPCRRWLTPDMRTEELVMGPDGKELPRLTLVWNAYQLVFSVGPSTIPNAGFGVFLRCTSLVPTCTSLSLRKGKCWIWGLCTFSSRGSEGRVSSW
ncbi:hypothetical protein MHU86_3390 [Fragilaria crotonensis]|nr:hypothetical protein MHU86_3390 [Fragilaria crotonensis]